MATFSISSLAIGTHSITAVYSGDTGNNGATSSALSQTVTKITTVAPVVGWSPSPANTQTDFAGLFQQQNGLWQTGQVRIEVHTLTNGVEGAAIVSQTVTYGTDNGNGTFFVNGKAQIRLPQGLNAGTYRIRVFYLGDSYFTATSTSYQDLTFFTNTNPGPGGRGN